MDKPRYVQHVSGQGEKWEVCREAITCYVVPSNVDDKLCFNYFDLPKSEYCLCDPPERWVDVTEKCELTQNDTALRLDLPGYVWGGSPLPIGYRLRKVQLWQTKEDASICGLSKPQWAFIVEKREP